jgi:hypothetical protein
MASLIKKPVNDVGTSELNTSPRINKNHGTVVRKKNKKATHAVTRGWLYDGSQCD